MFRLFAVSCLVVLAGIAGGVAEVGAITAPPAPSGDFVVALFSASSNTPLDAIPVAGDSCGPTLRDLRKAGFKIIDVQGGGGLLYTLERDGHKGAIVILGCAARAETLPETQR